MKICILALKRLTHNTRVVRQAKALSEKGYSVTVLAIELPIRELMDMTPKVRYIRVELNPWPAKIIRFASRIIFFPRRIRNKLKQKLALIQSFLKMTVCRLKNYCKWGAKFLLGLPFLIITKSLILFRNFFRIQKDSKSQLQNDAAKNLTTFFIGLLRKILIPYMLQAKVFNFSSQTQAILANEKFDFCQAHDSFSLLATRRLADKSEAKLIYDALEAPDERSGVALSGTPQWLRKWESRRDGKIIRSADIVMTIGPALAEWTAEKYGISADPVVIKNCSLYREPVANLQLRKDLGLPDNHLVGLLLGSIYRDQGIEQLIDAMPLLHNHIHIALLGPISQQNYGHHLNTLIKENGVENRLHILPVQPQHLVLQYASGADFGIIARQATTLNNRLSLPNKIFELIMSRLPIVAGRLPNIEAIVKEYAIGDIFDETDPQDIARVMNKIANEKVLKKLRMAVEKAAQICCWEKESAKYVKVFE